MAGYIGSKAAVVSSGAERKKTFDITGTTTSLTGLSYTVNQVHVFHNGVRLVDGTDFTATNGSSITLTSAAESGDEVVVISYAGYQVSDTVSASQGGTFAGDVTMSGNLNTTDVLPSTDSTSDLGSTSKRFQDLYLSGGVYLGGTGSANKLDDYEAGTFTVGFTGATVSAGNYTGYYTKIGQVVHWNYYSQASNISGASGNAGLTGLPFTVLNNLNAYQPIVTSHNTFFGGSATAGVSGYQNINTTTVQFLPTGGVSPSTFVNGGSQYIMVSGTYITAS